MGSFLKVFRVSLSNRSRAFEKKRTPLKRKKRKKRRRVSLSNRSRALKKKGGMSHGQSEP
jgi:hypothetical protein